MSRFRDQFDRPDVVALVLETLDVGEVVRRANAVSGRKTAAAVAESLPPVVKIISPADQSSDAKSPMEVFYFVRSPTPVTVTVLLDDRPVATPPPKMIERGPNSSVARLSIDMPQHDAKNLRKQPVLPVGHPGKPGNVLFSLTPGDADDRLLSFTVVDGWGAAPDRNAGVPLVECHLKFGNRKPPYSYTVLRAFIGLVPRFRVGRTPILGQF